MAVIQVAGMDPSLRNWGLARGLYDTFNKELEITSLRVIQPVLPKKAKHLRKSSLDLMAAEQLTEELYPDIQGIPFIFVEVPHGSQSAMAMKGYGICIGILGSLRARGLGFLELSQREVKLATVGREDISKKETIDWATQQHPNAPWPTLSRKGQTTINASKAEHMADAVATIHTGIASAYFTTFT